jgi:hypothetical protein
MAFGWLVISVGIAMNKQQNSIVISDSPRVTLVKNFLTPTECNDLIFAAENHHAFDEAAPYNSVYLDSQSQAKHSSKTIDLLKSIEKRIAEVTGVKRHEHEESLNIHRILPTDHANNLENIHHGDNSTQPTLITTYENYNYCR